MLISLDIDFLISTCLQFFYSDSGGEVRGLSGACQVLMQEDILLDLWGVAFTVVTADPRLWSGSGHTRLTRKLSPGPCGFIRNALAGVC